ALLLLLLDVALRRLDLSAFGRAGMVTTIQKVAASPPPRPPPAAVVRAAAAAAESPPPSAPAGGGEEQAELARVAVTPIGEDLVPDTPEAGDGTYVGGLLAARRRAKDRMDD
ncbi:MAG: hypothetical protein QGH45_05290, partial [Myxococcota bacterium]|nr:hypothetical protein [Myxococcota bacterium]